MKKLLKSVICGSMNSVQIYCSWTKVNKCGQKKKKKTETQETQNAKAQNKHTLGCVWIELILLKLKTENTVAK